MPSLLITSGFGGNTNKPFVMVEGEQIDTPIQFSPAEARDLAHNLLQAAEAAETDAFIVTFATDEIKFSREQVAGILVMFREFRDKMRKQLDDE